MPTPPLDALYDGHTHTSWCPHADSAPLRDYLERAVRLGLKRYAVTEHFPLPPGLLDPFGPCQCAGSLATIGPYLDEAETLREEFAGRLTVLVGFEIDYLGAVQGGFHGELLAALAPVWPRLDHDATIVSVHFLDGGVVDGTAALTRSLLRAGETVDAIHLRYYRALQSALTASWRFGRRDLRPRRVGHLTLPNKFIRELPLHEPERVLDAATAVLELVAREGLELDLNTAGLSKPGCGELYLPEPLLSRAVELGIPLVLGSDAHEPSRVAAHFDLALTAVRAALGRRAVDAAALSG